MAGIAWRMLRCPAVIVCLLLILLWVGSLLLACLYGPYPIGSLDVVRGVLAALGFEITPLDPRAQLIVFDLRLPRALIALLCGGGLAISGVCLQGVLKNTLADPFTLGISQGAACGASLFLVGVDSAFVSQLGVSQIEILALAAFLGACVATTGTLWLGSGQGRCDAGHILLAGIAVATFLGALVAFVKSLNEESVASIVFWIMGSFQGRSWETLPLVAGTVLPGALCLLFFWRGLDLFFLGDEQAAHMGLAVGRLRFLVLLLASFMTAGCVAAAGVIGFVGLVVPHMLRLVLGVSHAPLLCSAFFGGGILLLWADVLARTVLPDGQELPVGVITALLGGPFFAFLLKQRMRAAEE